MKILNSLLLFVTAAALLANPLHAAEPNQAPAPDPASFRDFNVLLLETELRVMIQQYEKTLTQLYEAQMALNLLPLANQPDPPLEPTSGRGTVKPRQCSSASRS